MEVTVNPGNVHDSVAFDGLYEKLTAQFPEIETIAADAGCKTPWICKKIIDDGRVPSMPYKRPMTKKGFSRNTSMLMMNISTAMFVRTIKF